MNCPICHARLIVGTVINGTDRRTYHVCPRCTRPRSRYVELPADQGADQGAGELPAAELEDTQDQIVTLLRDFPKDSAKRVAAFAALQTFHARCLAAIRRYGSAPVMREAVERERVELLAELRRVEREGGAE